MMSCCFSNAGEELDFEQPRPAASSWQHNRMTEPDPEELDAETEAAMSRNANDRRPGALPSEALETKTPGVTSPKRPPIIMTAEDALFDRLDKNHDGVLTREEFEKFKARVQDMMKPASPRSSSDAEMEHPLIKQGASNPMAIGALNALNVFDLTDCPGAVKNLDDIIIKPNIDTGEPSGKGASAQHLADDVIQKVNGKRGPSVQRLPLGRMVHEGYIQFLEHGGRTSAVGAGKWVISPGCGRWGKTAHVSEKLIAHGSVTIAWVQHGEIGLAMMSGREVLLDAGLHVYNNPAFIFDRSIDKNVDYIKHGTFHIIRVPRGKFAKVWVASTAGGKQPRLLSEGLHAVDSSFFSYEGMCPILVEKHIVHGGLQLLRVPSGHVAKITNDSQPQLLGPGFHFFEGMHIQYVSMVCISDKVITHGRITVVRVSRGEVLVAWLHNEPLILEDPGVYGYDDPKFVYVRHQPARDKIVGLGEKKVVKVKDGEVAISHQHGKLRILKPGRHILDDPTHTVGGFLPKEDGDKLIRGIHTSNPTLICGCNPLPYKFVEAIEPISPRTPRLNASMDGWKSKSADMLL